MSQGYEYFGKYILLEKLQSGGMAEVFLARSPGASGISRFVAVKRILPQFSEQAEFIDMFKDEAKIAVNISHANIVSIFEFGVEREQFFLAMDYVEGRNLRQILNKMKKSGVSLSVEQVIYIIKEVANGLDNAHRCIDSNTGKPLNIIHRDMSPQNVMVSFEGEVKIIDFGIAKAETQIDTTRTGTLKGKFGYMSPEQAEGVAVDLRTDIFALGIVLWELLANDRLFIASNEVNTLRKIRDCQIPSLRKINPNIPPELERIVSKALAKDRNMRYQTAAAFERELSRFLNRQYPDFSPHDFSVFIKTLFAAEILDSRKKMIEYARVEPLSSAAQVEAPILPPENFNLNPIDQSVTEQTLADLDELDEDSVVDFGSSRGTDSNANTLPPPTKRTEPAVSTKSTSRVGPPTSRTDRAQNADAKSRPAAPAIAPKPPVSVASVSTTQPPASASTRPRSNTGVYDTQGLSVDHSPYREGSATNYHPSGTYQGGRATGSTTSHTKRFRASGLIGFLLIVISVGAGAYGVYSYDHDLVSILAKQLGLVPPQPGKIEVTSEAEFYNVSVNSAPPGAEILINDEPKGEITPANIRLERGKTIKLTVRLQGYASFEDSFTVTSDRAINASLISERRGYLDIQVSGAGQIMIDGKVIATVSPANRVPVPANREVLVSAFDPVTKAWDEQRVRVAENATRKIVLIPRAGGKRDQDSSQKK